MSEGRPYGVLVRGYLRADASAEEVARRREELARVARARLVREGFDAGSAEVRTWQVGLLPTPPGEIPYLEEAELSMCAWSDPERTHIGLHVRLVVQP